MKPKIFLVASAVVWLAVSSIFAAIPPAEQLLPADTLVMFTVPDCGALRAEARQSPQWLLWNDPAMKPFRDDFTAKWNSRFIAPFEQALGVKADDYLPLLQGQLTLAVTQNGWNGAGNTGPALLLLLDAKDKGDLLATNLAALKREWTDSGKLARTEILEGVKFSILTLSSNASPPFAWAFPHGDEAGPKTLYLGQFKSLLIAGTSVKAVESVAAHLNGGANPSLRQNGQFAADQAALFHGGPLYYGWFNGKTFFNVLSRIQSDPDSDSSPVSWDKILLASGFLGLKSASFSYRESHDGAQIEFFADAPESSRQGLLKIVTAAAKDAGPPAFVPADAVKFWRWRVDGQQSWDELEKTLGTVSPSLQQTLDSMLKLANAAAQVQDPDFDIRKDLIGNLGDDWMSFAKAPAGNTLEDLTSAPSLFLFAANNADRAVLALKTVASLSLPGGSPQTRNFLGRKIYTISLPARGGNAPNGGGAPRSFYCAASGGYVALTSDVSMIENYLRSDDGKTKPLSRIPGLMEAAERVGGMNRGLFGYQNQREAARALFAALKNDPAAGSAALNPLAGLPFAQAGANGLRDLMNFSLLPDFDAISKYFNFTVYSGASTSQGLDFKCFQPRPPELN